MKEDIMEFKLSDPERVRNMALNWEFGVRRFRERAKRVATSFYNSVVFGRRSRDVPPVDAEKAMFEKLAEQYRMGDIEAMYEMALWHRRKCVDEELAVLLDYEKRPDDESAQKTIRALWCHNIHNYAVWLVRSALYGHQRAEEILAQYSLYREVALISARLMDPYERERNPKRWDDFWRGVGGWQLHKAGFTDIPDDDSYCSLWFLNKDGFYVFSYLADYIPADEYGFGQEDYYEDLYLDEFFNLLPNLRQKGGELPAPEVIKEELDKMDAKREKYWRLPEHDIRRKYRKRMRKQYD